MNRPTERQPLGKVLGQVWRYMEGPEVSMCPEFEPAPKPAEARRIVKRGGWDVMEFVAAVKQRTTPRFFYDADVGFLEDADRVPGGST